MKKPFVSNILALGAAFVIIALPLPTHAGALSFVGSIIRSAVSETSADESSYNSQTMPLLQAAVNIDPKPSRGGGDITLVDGEALLPEAGPLGTLAEIEERPASSQISVYVVRKGDTLGGIAEMFGVSVNTIVWANELERGIIREGQNLVILPVTGLKHTVVKGDTLAGLAKKYKTEVRDIADFNGLSDGASLSLGAVLIIPNVELAAPAAPKKPAATARLRGASQNDLGGFFLWPVEGGVKTQGLHGYNGIDIGAPRGTSVYAAAAGTVLIARGAGWNGGYGQYVVITHDNGVQTLYGHLSGVTVVAGQRLIQGQILGFVGSTGRSTGNHLHFEVRGAKNPF